MMDLLFVKIYSIGSSIQVITHVRSVLIKLIIAARVVVLPVPVGPVINTKPFCLRANSAITGGNCNSSMEGTNNEIRRKAASTDPRWICTFTRKRSMPVKRQGKVKFFVLFEFLFLGIGQGRRRSCHGSHRGVRDLAEMGTSRPSMRRIGGLFSVK